MLSYYTLIWRGSEIANCTVIGYLEGDDNFLLTGNIGYGDYKFSWSHAIVSVKSVGLASVLI